MAMPLEQWAPWARVIAWAAIAAGTALGGFVGVAVLEFALQHSKPRRHKAAP